MTDRKLAPEQRDLEHASSEIYFVKLIKILLATENDTVEDFTKPKLRPSMENIYPLFVIMYGILVVSGTLMNCGMIYHITYHKLHRDSTYAFLINIAISDLIKCLFVLPITFIVILIENWIFGQFLCYFLPILQDMPIHVSMMTYFLITGDRYRLISDPGKPQIPAFVCAVGSWMFAVCIVLPHPIYTTYLDLGVYQKIHLRGVGLCITNLTDNIERYIKGLLVMTYIAPLIIIAYIYVKSGRELQMQEGHSSVAICEARINESHSRHGSSIRNEVGNRTSPKSSTTSSSGESRTPDLPEVELDICKEKRTQKYLGFMITAFAVLFGPLMVLKLVNLSVDETYENTHQLDIIFLVFIWLGFLSTVTTPIFYAAWQMNRSTEERLRANLLCCYCRSTSLPENGIEMTNDHGTGNVEGGTNVLNERIERSSASRSIGNSHAPRAMVQA